MSTEELIKALRCLAAPEGAESCAGCSYRVVEQMSDEDAAEYGIAPGAEFERCDVDRMALDAADLLEKLNAERDAAVKDILARDHCDVCKYNHGDTDQCEANEYDCCGCKAPCMCASCRDESKWQWRGMEGRTE